MSDLCRQRAKADADRADRLADDLAALVAGARERGVQLPRRPKVYFEEWDDPMISGIGWVSELIDAAGDIDIFADRASCKSATDRIVTTEEIIRREPDIIVGSWCGKKFRPEKSGQGLIAWPPSSAARCTRGPAALTDGLIGVLPLALPE